MPVGFLEIHDPGFVIQHGAGRSLVVAVNVVDPIAGVQSIVRSH